MSTQSSNTEKPSENYDPLVDDNTASVSGVNTLNDIIRNLNIDTDSISSGLNNALNRVANPEFLSQMTQAIPNMDPEMKEKAMKLAKSDVGQDVMKKMTQKGFSLKKAKQQAKAEKKLNRGTGPNTIISPQKIVFINSSRQVKSKTVSANNISNELRGILGPNTKTVKCPHLERAQLSAKNVICFYNGDNKVANRRASKLLGVTVGGDVYFTCHNKTGPVDISIALFESLEKLPVPKTMKRCVEWVDPEYEKLLSFAKMLEEDNNNDDESEEEDIIPDVDIEIPQLEEE